MGHHPTPSTGPSLAPCGRGTDLTRSAEGQGEGAAAYAHASMHMRRPPHPPGACPRALRVPGGHLLPRGEKGRAVVDGYIVPSRHPHPASPIEGEVRLCGWGTIGPRKPDHTSPSMGEAGRGWGAIHRTGENASNKTYPRPAFRPYACPVPANDTRCRRSIGQGDGPPGSPGGCVGANDRHFGTDPLRCGGRTGPEGREVSAQIPIVGSGFRLFCSTSSRGGSRLPP